MEAPVANTSEDPSVVDLQVPHHTGLLGLVLVAALTVALLYAPLRMLGLSPKVLCELAGATALVGGSVALERLNAHRIRRRLRALPVPPPEDRAALLRSLVPHLKNYTAVRAMNVSALFVRRSVLGAAAQTLLNAGHAGTAYRLSSNPATLKALPPPLDVPLEPVPLRQRSPAFAALVDDAESTPHGGREFTKRLAAVDGPTQWLRLFAFVCLGLVSCWLAYVFYKSIPGLCAGTIPRMLPIAFPGIVLGTAFGLWRLRRTYAWFIVPAALVVCSSTWRSKSWNTYLLTRSQSVLMYWSNLHMLAIACPHGSYCRHATPREAELAFRAWLSPLDPPPPEQLTDLR